MTTCTSCGNDVTGKKFCSECGTPVQPPAPTAGQPASVSTCPRCNGQVKPGAAFCMHCGSSLTGQHADATQSQAVPASQPSSRICPTCRTEVAAGNGFCTNCGQNLQVSAEPPTSAMPAPIFCTNCGTHNSPGVNFCANCGTQLAALTRSQPYSQYPQQYAQQYSQQYPQYAQPYSQYPPQYGQGGYSPEPMLGQQPMVLRCPTCMAMSPLGTTHCPGCHTSLAGIVPTPGYMQQGSYQQGGFGGLGAGALGGAAAVIGGEILLHEVEHRHEGEGLLGGLGDIANDIGLL